MKDEDRVASCVGLVSISLVALVFAALVDGYTLSQMWSWFVSPIFQVPQLTIPYAIGISLIVSMLTYRKPNESDKKKEIAELIGELIGTTLTPLFFLGAGWVVHLFI